MKLIGGILFGLMLILGIATMIFNIEPDFLNLKTFSIWSDKSNFTVIENNIWDEIISSGLIVGGLLFGFSKEKVEDEYIAAIRLKSLAWATYVNYGTLLFAIFFVYSFSFFNFLIFNMFTLLIFFIIRFNWELYKFKMSNNEE